MGNKEKQLFVQPVSAFEQALYEQYLKDKKKLKVLLIKINKTLEVLNG